MRKRGRYLLPTFLFLVAFFLRSYRITEFTEFLGDQGSAASVVFNAFRFRSMLLHGPAISSGQYPGPFYYYIIAPPLILSGFRPEFGALTFALFGALSAVILSAAVAGLYGGLAGYAVGFLYAVSPKLVMTERNMWNPSPTPFLFTLAFYAMVRLEKKGSLLWGALLFAAGGILIQLHYTNLFILCMFIAYYIIVLLRRRKHVRPVEVVKGVGVSIGAFLIVMLPFLIFELQRNFSDITGVISVYGATREEFVRKSVRIARMYSSNAAQWEFVTAGLPPQVAAALLALAAFFIVRARNVLPLVMLLTFTAARYVEGGYAGTLYTHYRLYTGVFPFAFLGSILGQLKKRSGLILIPLLTLPFLVNSLMRTDILSKGNRDLPRTRAGVQTIIEDAGAAPFAFTVTHTRSYSDYHYRFFFEKSGIKLLAAASPDTRLFYIICDSANCPDDNWMRDQQSVYVLCYDHHCDFEYPNISLLSFKYMGSLKTGESVVYKFVR